MYLYFNKGDWKEKEFIDRLRCLIVGKGSRSFEPYQKGGGNDSWVLDEGNNWFLLFYDNNLVRLSNRYCVLENFGRPLETTINMLLKLKPLTKEQENYLKNEISI